MTDFFSRPCQAGRRIRSLLVLACASVVVACAVPAFASAAPEDNAYVALGDSLAYGLGASSPSTTGYVGLLYSDFQSSLGVTQLSNRGEPGTSSTSLRNGGQLTTALADIGASSDTRAVTIDIGFIDGCEFNYGNSAVCPFRENLAAILSELQRALDADPGAEVFSTTLYYNPGVGTPSEALYDRGALGDNLAVGCSDTGADAGLNDVIAQEGGKLGVPVADPYPAFKQNGQAFISGDQLHPNDAGYAAIAQAFREASIPCSKPTDKDQCKDGGWRNFPQFKNQGQCIRFVKKQALDSCLAERARLGRAAFRDKYGAGRRHRHALGRCVKLAIGAR